ncbi:MAG: hypothetical protein M3Y87_05630 [Myxococcota bacterium]|nr:hypothetical protein [Myxococcota bacterium]
MSARARLAAVLVVAGAIAQAGCYGNTATAFPAGSEPWEVNMAPMPEPTEGDPCPEDQITFHRTGFEGVRAVHARACVHQPLSEVWRALRDPQTSRDPTTTAGFRVVEYDVSASEDPAPAYSYRTAVHVDDIIDLDFEQTWRHYLAEGTDDAPELTATRWQKTFGSDALIVMQGSIVARPLEADPSITLLEYQYHLDAVARDDHGTIESFLRVIYGRLRQRAHGETLEPNDCVDCAEPPAHY